MSKVLYERRDYAAPGKALTRGAGPCYTVDPRTGERTLFAPGAPAERTGAYGGKPRGRKRK